MAPPKGSSRNPSWFKTGGGVTGGESSNALSLADNLSYSMISKPFKDERKKKVTRRNKTLKQILTAERLRAKYASDTLLKINATGLDGDDVDMSNGPLDDSITYDQQQQQQQQSQLSTSKRAKKEILGPVNPDIWLSKLHPRSYLPRNTVISPVSKLPMSTQRLD